MSRAARWHLAGVLAVVAATAALYLPFLGNPLVFDDRIFFSGHRFAYYALNPLGLDLRLPPYFTLAVTEVLWSKSLEAQRIVSLVLHAGVALVLYRLLLDLQRAALPVHARADAPLRAAIGAVAFALHPVAVYGAGYLVQRSIVMATLFGLLSAVLFLRGLRRGSHADALSAALVYSLAVLSKEHAVLLAAAIAPVALLAGTARPFAVRHVALYFAACAPAALYVTLRSLNILGGAYEEAAGAVAAQVAAASGEPYAAPSLALSAVTQAGLFFKYLGLWLWPDPASMSIDLRVDFAAGWTLPWIVLKVASFLAWGAVGTLLLLRRGAAGIAGYGMLYAWILFLVEFSTVRYQEPFVLYRSYLWGAGAILVAVAVLSRFSRRGVAMAGLAVCTALAYLAHDRLLTFSDPLRLWADAVDKLPEGPVPWGSRTLYQAGREYLYAGQPAQAIAVTERCAQLYPTAAHCAYAKGAIHLHLGEFEPARQHLLRALQLKPAQGIVYHRLGLALEGLARIDEARSAFRRAWELGYGGGKLELERLDGAAVAKSPPK
jgi:tetratricopeptide (TPR) repeat protein